MLEPQSLREDVLGRLREAAGIEERRKGTPAGRDAERSDEEDGAMTPVSTRVVRLLNMVPYLQANPRITKAAAAADLGVSEHQLKQDLQQLWMCGLPGYDPGDLIDFEFMATQSKSRFPQASTDRSS